MAGYIIGMQKTALLASPKKTSYCTKGWGRRSARSPEADHQPRLHLHWALRGSSLSREA